MRLTRPLVLLALAFALGILSGAWLAPSDPLLFGVTLSALLVAAVAWWRGFPAVGVVALLLAAAGAGALRWSWSDALARGTVGAWGGRPITLVAVVLDAGAGPDWRNYDVSVETVAENGRQWPAAGLVRVQQASAEGSALLPGQRGRFTGRLLPLGRRGADPEQLARLADRGIHYRLTAAAPPVALGTADRVRLLTALLRRRLTVGIDTALPPQPAALLAGLLLSETGDLPESVRDDFRRTGLTHLLAVDGGKVGAALAATLWLLARFGWHRRRAALAAIPVLVVYCLLAGATAAAVRATVTALAALAALALHRRVDPPSALALAALLLLLTDPHQLLQLGFQLSFAATLGILAFYPLLEHRLRRWPPWLVESAAVTVAVELAVEPLALHAFGGLPLISPLVHLWAIPLMAALVPLGGLMALASALQPGAGLVLGIPTRCLLWLLTVGAHLSARFPAAYWQPGRLPAWGVVLWYAVLGALAWAGRRRLRASAALRRSGSVRGERPGGVPAGG